MKTMNDLIGKIAARAKELADKKMDRLRSDFPETTDTESELIRMCKEMKYTRGDIIEAILLEEFCDELMGDVELPEGFDAGRLM